MSLDVTLTVPGACIPLRSAIFVREGGRIREITLEEWESQHPGIPPVRVEVTEGETTDKVFSYNITNNLLLMADEAGLGDPLWNPAAASIFKANQLIQLLKKGLERLESDPESFKEFNPYNGWGTYEGLVEFVKEYLAACEKYPDAEVSASF